MGEVYLPQEFLNFRKFGRKEHRKKGKQVGQRITPIRNSFLMNFSSLSERDVGVKFELFPPSDLRGGLNDVRPKRQFYNLQFIYSPLFLK